MSKCCELVNLDKGEVTSFFSFLKRCIYFIFWLWWVFVVACRLCLVAARGAALCCGARSSRRCSHGFSLQSTGSRRGGFSSRGS